MKDMFVSKDWFEGLEHLNVDKDAVFTPITIDKNLVKILREILRSKDISRKTKEKIVRQYFLSRIEIM